MAYQPKSYRKFIATAATATLVASAVSPAAAASGFTDVNDRYEDAVNYLVENDITVGMTETTFGVSAEIKRGDAAVFIAKALELDVENAPDAGFTDVNDRVAPYVNALKDAGYINGKTDTTFAPDASITRGEMALILSAAYSLEGDVDLDFTDVNDRYAEAVEALVANEITSGTTETTYGTNDEIKRGDFAIFLYRAEGGDVTAPKVVDVSADNNKQIVLTLSGNVDLGEVADADNYSLVDANGNDVEDFKVDVPTEDVVTTAAATVDVTITLPEGKKADNQDVYTLTIGEAVTGEEVVEEVEFFDTTVPEVSDAEVIGNDTVKVTFSEPIDVDDTTVNYKEAFMLEQDGSKLYVKSVTFLKNNTEANVEVYSTFEEGTLDLSVDNSLEDYADLNLLKYSDELDVVEDKEGPEVVGYKNATKTGVTLVFNEDIELTDADVTDFYHTNSGNTVDADDTATAEDEFGAVVDGNELTLTFTENELPEGTAYVYIDGETLLDKWDNLNESQIRVEVLIDVDETKPEVKEVKATEEALTVTFNEDIDAASIDEDSFQLLDSDGAEVDYIRSVDAKGSNGVTVEFTDALSGEYSIVIEDIEDLSGNVIDSVTKKFDVTDTHPIDTTDVNVTLVTDNADYYKLVVNYPEEMATSGKYAVNDLDNYEADNTVFSDLSGVEVDVIDNGTTVEFTISKEDNEDFTITTSGDSLTIARVADVSGNYTDEYSFSSPILATDAVTFSAKATAPKTLKLTFEDRVDLDINDFAVYSTTGDTVNISKASTAIVNGVTVATLTLASELSYNPVAAGAYVSVDSTPSSENRYGTAIATADVNITDSIAPALSYTNKVLDFNQSVDNEFTLTFTEDLTFKTDSLAATDFVLVDEDGDTLVPVSDYTVAEDTGVVTFKFTSEYLTEKGLTAYVGDLEISTASNAKYVKDVIGNVLADFDIDVDLEDK